MSTDATLSSVIPNFTTTVLSGSDAAGSISLTSKGRSRKIDISSPNTLSNNYKITLPDAIGTADQVLKIDSISDTGLKGSTYIEQIVPKYLNLMQKETNAEKLRKKSGR